LVVPQAAAKKVGEGAARDFPGGGAGGWETAGAVDLADAGRSEREQVFDVVCKKVLTGDFFLDARSCYGPVCWNMYRIIFYHQLQNSSTLYIYIYICKIVG
jgi:hypothetical protein